MEKRRQTERVRGKERSDVPEFCSSVFHPNGYEFLISDSISHLMICLPNKMDL